jgi:hypothetical protein
LTASTEGAVTSGVESSPDAASPYLEAASVGARAAGFVVALAYLTGAIPGPLLAVAGGLALVTYGHALLLERKPSLVVGAAFAVIVAALASGALRWSTLDLEELRGVQAVLGPTVLVEKSGADLPVLGPVAAWLAAAAGVIAMAIWLRFPRGEAWFSLVPWAGEMIVAALALATVFWGPAAVAVGSGDGGEIASELGRWALATLAVALPAAGLSFLLARLPRLWTSISLVVAVTGALSAVGISAALVAV